MKAIGFSAEMQSCIQRTTMTIALPFLAEKQWKLRGKYWGYLMSAEERKAKGTSVALHCPLPTATKVLLAVWPWKCFPNSHSITRSILIPSGSRLLVTVKFQTFQKLDSSPSSVSPEEDYVATIIAVSRCGRPANSISKRVLHFLR